MGRHQVDVLPSKLRGDRRVLDGIFLGVAVRRALAGPAGQFGPYTACYNRFGRRPRVGVWSTRASARFPRALEV